MLFLCQLPTLLLLGLPSVVLRFPASLFFFFSLSPVLLLLSAMLFLSLPALRLLAGLLATLLLLGLAEALLLLSQPPAPLLLGRPPPLLLLGLSPSPLLRGLPPLLLLLRLPAQLILLLAPAQLLLPLHLPVRWLFGHLPLPFFFSFPLQPLRRPVGLSLSRGLVLFLRSPLLPLVFDVVLLNCLPLLLPSGQLLLLHFISGLPQRLEQCSPFAVLDVLLLQLIRMVAVFPLQW
mmetsp:Transcript_15409/g.45081  ORF Transcript_15409/g.45081 Transcript_15409/m.45081 type:complete len:234 (-) Transcript_15409:143-844(-)